jgi:hypothetical protein
MTKMQTTNAVPRPTPGSTSALLLLPCQKKGRRQKQARKIKAIPMVNLLSGRELHVLGDEAVQQVDQVDGQEDGHGNLLCPGTAKSPRSH